MPLHRESPPRSSWSSRLQQKLMPWRHLLDSEVAALAYESELAELPASSLRGLARVLGRRHLNGCDHCRSRVQDARVQDSVSATLLAALDVPLPTLDAASVLARARRSDRSTVVGISLPRRPAPRFRNYAIAASVLFAMVGVTALALPGSPLRAVFSQLRRSQNHLAVRNEPAVRAPGTQAMSSVAIVPAGRLTVEFRGAATPPALAVRYCDTTFASLSVANPDVERPNRSEPGWPTQSARFSVSPDRIVVTEEADAGSARATYDLAVPDSTRALTIAAGNRIVNVPPPRRRNSGTDHCSQPLVINWAR